MLRSFRGLLAVTISMLVGCTSQPNLGQPANPLSQDTQATPRGQQVPSPEGTWHGKKAGVKFYPSGENLAYHQPVPTVHSTLTGHSQKMVPGVYQVAERVYLAYGYALTSPALIEGDDGVIIVDPPEDVKKGLRTLEEFRKFTDKPVKAVIYSHWHIDHFGGVRAFVKEEDVAAGKVQVIAHKTFLENVIKSSSGGLGPILGARVDYSLGTLLDVGPEGRVNGGLGPDFVIENPSLIPPNVLVDDELDLTVAGVRLKIVWVPSEAPDEIVVVYAREISKPRRTKI